MRILKILGAVIGIFVILIAVMLVVGIPGGLLTDVIQNRLERQTGYRLEVGATKISLRPKPTIQLTGVSLSDPQRRDTSIQLSVDSVKAAISLASLFSGNPHVGELIITRPVLHAPLHRERTHRAATSSGGAASTSANTDLLQSIGHIEIDQGTIIMADRRRGVENRLDKVGLDATIGSDRKVTIVFSAEAAGRPIALQASATIPEGPLSGLAVPVVFKFDAPALLSQQVAAAATVKFDRSTVLIDALNGNLDGAAFHGAASVDLESKPLVKVNLELARLGVGKPAPKDSSAPAPGAASAAEPDVLKPWSDKPLDLRGLNYLDAEIHLALGEFDIDTIKIAPAEVDANLTDGIVRGTLSKMGIYEGQAAAGVALDASSDTPSFALRTELRQVRALPLLSNAADFTSLDGKLDATINVQAIGGSPRDLVGNLSGLAVAKFQDGEVRGINVAKMVRALTNGTLSGWQQGQTETTDLTELSATFQIDHGLASTQDFKLAGPLVRITGIGAADLNTKAINFRVEPKLVMSIEGQGSSADPVGLGIPVMVQGPWNHPRIFPDMAGILDNPDAAYAQLRQLGQGLFGPNFLQQNGAAGSPSNNNNPAGNSGNNIMNNIGSLIQGLTGPKANQGQGQVQGAAPSQGAATPQGQGAAGQGPAAAPATGQQSGNQPAAGGSTAQGAAPNPQNQLDQIMQKLFGK